jgi:tetraacyldisaccharide-1-P 4'-kinase
VETGSGPELAQALEPFGFRGRGFVARTVVGEGLIERGDRLPAGVRVLVVTGIARPERVHKSLEDLPYEVAGSLSFPDHHDYPDASLDEISRRLEADRADWVLTTAKDHVKLLGRLEAPLAMLPLHCEPEPGFWSFLDQFLESFD